jgi:hypothetical protein
MLKKITLAIIALLTYGLALWVSSALAFQAVTIDQPSNGANVSSPVSVCMTTWGVEVEPAKKGVNEGKGHHHILVDVDLPDLGKPVPKDANHIHMGDGSTCKTIQLSTGKHTIRTLFAKGNHMPYNPPLTDMVVINVK